MARSSWPLSCRPPPQPAQSRPATPAVQLLFTPAQLFSYAERAYPGLFPAGPATQVIESGGKRYTVRYYASTGNYLGIGEDDGVLYGLGSFTGGVLQSLGLANSYVCEANNLACVGGDVGAASAWAGARVDARCAGGTTGSTANANGHYPLAPGVDALPCVLRATATDGSVMYSVVPPVASGLGGSRIVNITPLTSLVTAFIAGASPAAFYAGFSGSQSGRVSAAAVQGASTAVLATLRTAGIDFAAGGDLFNNAPLLFGANGTSQGRLIAQLVARLGGSLTQATLEDAIARTTPEAKAAGTPSLAPELLLAPAAPNCSALRSGRYLFATSDLANPLLALTLDAPALKFVELNLTLTAAGKCHYQQGSLELAVSDAGVLLGSAPIGSSVRAVVGAPAQALTVADLAGSWNSLTMMLDAHRPADGYLHSATATFDTGGRMTALTYCGKDAGKLSSDCLSGGAGQVPDIRLSINPAGGFFVTNATDASISQMLVYRSGSGALMGVTGGHLSFSTATRRNELPELGRVQEFWTVNVGTQDTVGAAMSESRNTVTVVDAAAGTFRRDNSINIATGATRPERLEANRYREGYTHRIPEVVTGTDGSTQNVSEFLALALRGTGLNAVGVFGNNQSLNLSLLKSAAP